MFFSFDNTFFLNKEMFYVDFNVFFIRMEDFCEKFFFYYFLTVDCALIRLFQNIQHEYLRESLYLREFRAKNAS